MFYQTEYIKVFHYDLCIEKKTCILTSCLYYHRLRPHRYVKRPLWGKIYNFGSLDKARKDGQCGCK